MSRDEFERLRKAATALAMVAADIETPNHADFCEGCATCHLFTAVETWLNEARRNRAARARKPGDGE